VSYIDSFDHEFVGYFGGLPVYHPLEVVPADPDDGPRDFACGPDHLVIGGGSGEHPAIVVKEPGETVACFVRAWLHWHQWQYPEEHAALRPAVDAWPDASGRVETCGYWRRVFEFAGWQAADHVAFSRRCSSPAFCRPFTPHEDGSVHPFAPGGDGCLERWLAVSVGEFILLAMPELASDAIRRLGELRPHISEGLYCNILLLPPGYPCWGRREVGHQVTWGVSAWQIQRAQNPRTVRGSDPDGEAGSSDPSLT
jgi:hypothetical protein